MATNDFILGGMPVTLGKLTTIDSGHYEIHEGEMYSASIYLGTLAGGGTATLNINAGTIPVHILWEADVGGDAKFTLTEGGTVTGASALSIYNRDRNSAASCLTTGGYGGTLTGGTIILQKYLAGGSGPKAIGGGSRSQNEIILRTSQVYTMQIINTTSAYVAALEVEFYEHADED